MITPTDALCATGGEWLREAPSHITELHGGAIDTRRLANAEIFFALVGEVGDGHDYLGQLEGSAIKLAVVQHDRVPPAFEGAVLRVPDTRRALQDMARWLVERHRPKVIVVTGSYGKTTAKQTIAHVLGSQLRVLQTPGSFNNEIGVPLTLLNLGAGEQDVVVLEFAARHEGDIDLLGRIAPPDVAILLNVGRAHVGVFGSLDATYRAKGEIFNHIRPGGLALVSAEDARLQCRTRDAGDYRIQTFGRETGDFYTASQAFDKMGRVTCRGIHGVDEIELRASLPGPHMVYPMLVAWAVARELGVPDALVQARAGDAPGEKGRASSIFAPGGATVIDDTYNASPETVVNLGRTLAKLDAEQRVLVLGHLSELEAGLEKSVGLISGCLQPPLSELWVHDPECPETTTQFAAASGISVRSLPSLEELIAALREIDRPRVAVGIKAARAAHLERAVHGMTGGTVSCGLTHCELLIHCTTCPALATAGS